MWGVSCFFVSLLFIYIWLNTNPIISFLDSSNDERFLCNYIKVCCVKETVHSSSVQNQLYYRFSEHLERLFVGVKHGLLAFFYSRFNLRD